jgi:hypothetical protein
MMKRLLTSTATALLLGLTPALAAESSTLPAQPGVSPDASKQANVPGQGKADTSGGAAEQSSANPSSKSLKSSEATLPDNNADQSKGAKEQSSAPPNSSAAQSKPNPTINDKSSGQY